jgi:hypothetical protein
MSKIEAHKTHYMKLINAFLLGIESDELNVNNWPMNEKEFIIVLIALFQKYPNAMFPRVDEIPQKGILENDYFYLYFYIDAFMHIPELIEPMLPIIIAKFPLLEEKIKNYIATNKNCNSLMMDALEMKI